MNQPTRVALYVSARSYGEFSFTEDCLDRLREACEKEGKVVVETYLDVGFSSLRLDRPSLQRMLEHAKIGAFDEVKVTRISHLSRSIPHFLNICDALQKHGVSIVSLSERFDSASVEGHFALQMAAAMAELVGRNEGEPDCLNPSHL